MKKNVQETQKARVKAWLFSGKTLTPLESWRDLGVYRISDVVMKIRRDLEKTWSPYRVETDSVDVVNIHGEIIKIGRYRLVDSRLETKKN